MDSDRQFICDALQEKAREYADMVLFDIMEKYKSAPWDEFRDALADIFLAGAAEGFARTMGLTPRDKPGAEAPTGDHPETNLEGQGD